MPPAKKPAADKATKKNSTARGAKKPAADKAAASPLADQLLMYLRSPLRTSDDLTRAALVKAWRVDGAEAVDAALGQLVERGAVELDGKAYRVLAVSDPVAETLRDKLKAELLEYLSDPATPVELETIEQAYDEHPVKAIASALAELVVEGRVEEDREEGTFAALPVVAQPDEDQEDPDDAQAAGELAAKVALDDAEDEPGKLTRPLRHDLTREDIDTLQAQRLAQDVTIEELQTQHEAVKATAAALKKRIDALQDSGMQLSKKIRTGFETRNVPIEHRREVDPREDSLTEGQRIMITYRLDTEQAIGWRQLTKDERQGILPFEAAPTPAKGAPNVVRDACVDPDWEPPMFDAGDLPVLSADAPQNGV